MPTISYIEVAYILKTFGLRGEIKVVLIDNIDLDFHGLDNIFLEDKGQKIPYFIESVSLKKNEIIVKLEDVNSPEKAKELCKKKIYIDASLRKLTIDVNNNPAWLKGYAACHEKKHLGTVDRLETYPQQVMAIVTQGDKELLIPLVEEFIEYIDSDNEAIYFLLPEGFLDL